jgi:hypothetical protein
MFPAADAASGHEGGESLSLTDGLDDRRAPTRRFLLPFDHCWFGSRQGVVTASSWCCVASQIVPHSHHHGVEPTAKKLRPQTRSSSNHDGVIIVAVAVGGAVSLIVCRYSCFYSSTLSSGSSPLSTMGKLVRYDVCAVGTCLLVFFVFATAAAAAAVILLLFALFPHPPPLPRC